MKRGPRGEPADPRRDQRRSFVRGLAILDVFVILVGIAGAHDLRKLESPQGVAADFLRAASAGDCDRMAALAPTTSPLRNGLGDSAFCRQEHARYAGVAVIDPVIQRGGDDPVASVRIETPSGTTSPLLVQLTGTEGHWTVVSITAFG
jgi:hypothetical protein